MGTLIYQRTCFPIADRTLAHMQALIAAKLSRHEPFMLTWRLPLDVGSGRRTLWIDNGIPIRIALDAPRTIKLDRAWLEQMLVDSYRPGGTVIQTDIDLPIA